MKYYYHETKEVKFNLYPFVCWHRGVTESDLGFIKKIIALVKNDPYGMWLYLGDGGDCITKQSKGDIYSQLLSPTEQQNDLVKLLEPVKGKGLFGIKGNHGNRIYKETGLDFDETLCSKLGIPYLGTAAFWHLKLGAGTGNPTLFSIFCHHGTDSGVSIASKVTKGQVFDRTIVADAIMTAHSHVAMDLPPRYYATLADTRRTSDPIQWNATHEYICGSAYDSRTGYAEDKAYPPLLPSHLVITFKQTANERRGKEQSSVTIRKEDI